MHLSSKPYVKLIYLKQVINSCMYHSSLSATPSDLLTNQNPEFSRVCTCVCVCERVSQ